MPRSAIMITKSLRLNLKLVYQLTQRMMIWPSKCRPLNSASIGPKGRILPSSAIGSVCTRAHRETFFETELAHISGLQLGTEGVRHAVQFHCLELLQCGLIQHI